MTRLSSLLLAGSLLIPAAVVTGCTTSDDDATLTVTNRSSVDIDALYIDESGGRSFSDNLLGNNPLLIDQSITIGLDCGTYNVQLIDEENEDCEIDNVDFCLNDADYVITDSSCTFVANRTDPTSAITVPKQKMTQSKLRTNGTSPSFVTNVSRLAPAT